MTETELAALCAAITPPDEAARADNVCRVVCGLPVYYKGGEKL